MVFTVPNAKNYASPLIAVPLDWIGPPVEGNKGIQCSIPWTDAFSGTNRSVYMNMQNNATLNFSKIRALVFDNSANGSDVQVIFPDTETTITIPSYTPYAVIPVFTNQTQFYIVSPNALTTDKTSFMILNTLPPPIAVPTTQEQNIASFNNIPSVGGADVTQIVPATVTGTIEFISVSVAVESASVNTFKTFQIVDGNGAVYAGGQYNLPSGGYVNTLLLNLADVRLRFQNGLKFVQGGTATASDGAYCVNVGYRTP